MITSDLCDNVSFSCAPVRTRDLFPRYPDRLIYGTDLDTRLLQRGEAGMRFVLRLAWLIRAMLEKSDRVYGVGYVK